MYTAINWLKNQLCLDDFSEFVRLHDYDETSQCLPHRTRNQHVQISPRCRLRIWPWFTCVSPRMPFQVKRVVESFSTERADVSFDFHMTLQMALKETGKLERFAANTTDKVALSNRVCNTHNHNIVRNCLQWRSCNCNFEIVYLLFIAKYEKANKHFIVF
jgi:hypothetical protein